MPQLSNRLRHARLCVIVFIIGLILSGLTAMPVRAEMEGLARGLGFAHIHDPAAAPSAAIAWLVRVREAIIDTDTRYPFLFYGYDWLAFGHLAIALAFVPAYRDPARHRWLFTYGLVLCGLVIVWALAVAPFRGIPPGWRLLDCSFGILGAIPLLIGRAFASPRGSA